MKTMATVLFFVLTQMTFAQTVFTVDGFAEGYYGKIGISDTSEVTSKGWIAIFDKKTDKQVINVVSDELYLELHNGEAIANIKSLPYGEQSLIMYDDFNFDGKKDFAIEDGQNGCYSTPSFKIYLADGDGFSLNEAFTKLAQESCGMFQVDYKEKKLSTQTKDGCCWHEYSKFVVEDNKPKVIKIVTEDQQNAPFDILTEQTWNGTTMEKKTTKTIDYQLQWDLVLSFTVPDKEKTVVLCNTPDNRLIYALVRKDSTVEFSYPAERVDKNPDFKFDSSAGNRSVTFSNKSATYMIYDRSTELGIEITVGGKTYHWVGDNKTREGGLDKLLEVQLDNVVNQNEPSKQGQ